MTSWESVFRQSKVNNGDYHGDYLPVQNWDWPQETWFQKRLRLLRNASGRYATEFADEKLLPIQ